MASNTVWGLDIGSSAIKVAKMQRSGTECSIVDFDIVDIPGSDDPADKAAKLQTAMKSVTETHKFGNDPVYLAIPGSVCLHREFSLPPGSEPRLQEMVTFEARQQIPFPLDQVEWGYERYESADDSKAINVTLIAVRKSDIQDLLNLAEQFNLKLAGIAPAPVALYNFIGYEFRPTTTTLILDAGSRGTDFVVMNKRQIYFRSIQTAGREITKVLENKFKVPFEKAENLKKNIEQSKQMDQILTVIEPTLRNLGADVQRTIGFYKSKARGQKISQCYLLGHTFRLPRMAEFLQAQIREAPFAIVEGLQRVRLGPTVSREVWENEFPTMAVAVGLGLQGLGLGDLTLNLIPSEKEEETIRSQWKKWSLAAAAAVLISLGVSYYFASTATTKYDEATAGAAKTLEAVKTSADQVDKAIQPIPPSVELLQRLARIGHDRGKVQNILNSIVNIKSSDGKPLFGESTHLHLTNVYTSRAPLSREGRQIGLARNDKLVDKEEIKHFYEPLKYGGEPLAISPELRPDAPMVVVVSGEVEVVAANKTAALTTVQGLEDTIKFNFKDKIRGETQRVYGQDVTVTYEETVPEYDYKGDLKKVEPNAQPATPAEVVPPNKYVFMPFHLMFVWDDPADKDIVPAAPAAPVTAN